MLRKPLAVGISARCGARGAARILYDIVEERLVVIVVQVDHRADVYRPR